MDPFVSLVYPPLHFRIDPGAWKEGGQDYFNFCTYSSVFNFLSPGDRPRLPCRRPRLALAQCPDSWRRRRSGEMEFCGRKAENRPSAGRLTRNETCEHCERRETVSQYQYWSAAAPTLPLLCHSFTLSVLTHMFLQCLLLLHIAAVLTQCPNGCSNHGQCTGVARCECYGLWTQGDCSQSESLSVFMKVVMPFPAEDMLHHSYAQ